LQSTKKGNPVMATWWVYIIDKNSRYYVGITTDVANRMCQHGKIQPLYVKGPMSRDNAVKREKTIKGWSRKKKEALISSGLSKN